MSSAAVLQDEGRLLLCPQVSPCVSREHALSEGLDPRVELADVLCHWVWEKLLALNLSQEKRTCHSTQMRSGGGVFLVIQEGHGLMVVFPGPHLVCTCAPGNRGGCRISRWVVSVRACGLGDPWCPGALSCRLEALLLYL